MKKLVLFILPLLLLPVHLYAGTPLSHIKGVHAVGVRAGTGLGQTYDIGVLYQYHFTKRWSFITNIDYESGAFKTANYWGIKVYPGVECSIWHPVTWFYLHLTGDINVGYDSWGNNDISKYSSGAALGIDLGFNMEFYAIPELSFVFQAQEGWDWGFYGSEGYNYFHPLFTAGIKYNIK